MFFISLLLNKYNKKMNATIGKKLRDMRKQKGWSQEQVADSLYLSQSAYARIENGESCSLANNLDQICKVFEITPEELVKNENGVVINHNQQGGGGYIQVVNQLSEKLIEQYEERIKELKETISLLKDKN